MRITFIVVGALKASSLKDGVSAYLKRINRYLTAEVVEVREARATPKTPREDALKKEASKLIDKIKEGGFVAVCADNGDEFTSKRFAAFIEDRMSRGCRNLTFIIGGAYGLHASVVERADAVVSLSRMTLPHDLARLVLFEQVYRAFTIIKGEPYSH